MCGLMIWSQLMWQAWLAANGGLGVKAHPLGHSGEAHGYCDGSH
jgi:hypothetical protein